MVRQMVFVAFVPLGCVQRGAVEPPPPAPSPAASSAPTRSEPQSPVETGRATYYSRKLVGRPTASGERYDPTLMTAAHRTLPFGTWVQVRRKDGRSVVVRINDRGPFTRSRTIDLSERAAAGLGMIRDGVAWVEIRVLPGPPDASAP